MRVRVFENYSIWETSGSKLVRTKNVFNSLIERELESNFNSLTGGKVKSVFNLLINRELKIVSNLNN